MLLHFPYEDNAAGPVDVLDDDDEVVEVDVFDVDVVGVVIEVRADVRLLDVADPVDVVDPVEVVETRDVDVPLVVLPVVEETLPLTVYGHVLPPQIGEMGKQTLL
jgi:hypothetical protein